jgi:hypothetical protein
MAGRFNIEIKQGSTFSVSFRLRHTIVLSAAASASATTLNVSPIPHSITSGSTLTFGTVTVTLSANATIGDRTLSVNAISAAIAKSATAKGDPVDLTGKSVRAAIRKDFSDTTPLATFTCAITSPATLGEVSILLPSTTSAALPANIRPNRVDDIADLQSSSFPDSTEAKLFLPGFGPYVYDIEVFDSAVPPVVQRYVYGLTLVSSEATK